MHVPNLKIPVTSCGESPTVNENVVLYSLANPAASNGYCARCSVQTMMMILISMTFVMVGPVVRRSPVASKKWYESFFFRY